MGRGPRIIPVCPMHGVTLRLYYLTLSLACWDYVWGCGPYIILTRLVHGYSAVILLTMSLTCRDY